MKKFLLIAVIVCLPFMFASAPKKAECVYCPTYTCYGEYSCGQCKCMKQGNAAGGTCVSFQVYDYLMEKQK